MCCSALVPIYGTLWILLVVFTIARLSYGTRMTNSGLIQIHPELEESAQMSGASLAKIFRRVLLPLLAPTLLYAWLWIALLTFRELTLAVILTSSTNTTLPVVIWSLWLGGGLGPGFGAGHHHARPDGADHRPFTGWSPGVKACSPALNLANGRPRAR